MLRIRSARSLPFFVNRAWMKSIQKCTLDSYLVAGENEQTLPLLIWKVYRLNCLLADHGEGNVPAENYYVACSETNATASTWSCGGRHPLQSGQRQNDGHPLPMLADRRAYNLFSSQQNAGSLVL